jgi:hypothetical protein
LKIDDARRGDRCAALAMGMGKIVQQVKSMSGSDPRKNHIHAQSSSSRTEENGVNVSLLTRSETYRWKGKISRYGLNIRHLKTDIHLYHHVAKK